VSVIDFLQEWNLNKKLERFAKTKLQNKSPEGLSAIEPCLYQQRFAYYVRHVF